MKKGFSLFFAIALIFFLAVPAMAASSEMKRAEISNIVLPVAGEKAGEAIQTEAKVLLSVDGKSQPEEKKFSATAKWSETDSGTVLKKNDAFVSGRSYRLTVELEFMEAPKVKDETVFAINGKEAKYDSNRGETVLFYCDFVATPASFAPKVAIEAEGEEKTKEYDGKGIVLRARVEKIDGVEYRYEWYRDGEKLEAEKGESLTAKNVLDSGEYHCKVIASIPTDQNSLEKSTESAALKIKITPRVVNLQIEDAEKNLFDPDPEFTYEILGEVFDELTGSLSRMEGEEIGKYSILIGTLAFPEAVAENYELRVSQGTLTILDVGQLPFESVKTLADQSYIVGKNGAKIRVSATRGAIPEKAILSLSLPEASAKEEVEATFGKKVLKSFAVSLLDENGKALSLPRHATIKIQIPLSAEEENFDSASIKGAFFGKEAKELKTEVVKTGEVTYLVIEMEELGSVLLLEGEKAAGEKADENEKDPPKKSGFAWMWILIAVASLLSVGAVAFSIWWIKKEKVLDAGEKSNKAKKTPPALAKKEDALAEKKKSELKEAEKKEAPPQKEKAKKEATPPKTISFEDLED